LTRKEIQACKVDENNLNTLLAEVAKVCKHSFSTCMQKIRNYISVASYLADEMHERDEVTCDA